MTDQTTTDRSCTLVDRLRGKYAMGPHLPNGEPEFGWRQFEAPPIQHQAAARIEALEAERDALRAAARTVLDRLDSPHWKAASPTAAAMADLRAALGDPDT